MSDDGSVIAYAARLGDRQFCVVGDRRGPAYQKVWPPAMTSDGRAIAYVAEDESGCFVVHRGVRGPAYRWAGQVALSRDGTRVAYVAEVDASYRQAAVIDHQPDPPFQRVTSPIFSADGRVAAYGAFADGQWRVVAGDRSISVNDAVVSVFVNADGSHVGCVTEGPRGKRVVAGGVEGAPYDWIGWPMFAEDGRVVHFASRAASMVVVVDGRETQLDASTVWDVELASDRILFSARRGRELWRKSVSLVP